MGQKRAAPGRKPNAQDRARQGSSTERLRYTSGQMEKPVDKCWNWLCEILISLISSLSNSPFSKVEQKNQTLNRWIYVRVLLLDSFCSCYIIRFELKDSELWTVAALKPAGSQFGFCSLLFLLLLLKWEPDGLQPEGGSLSTADNRSITWRRFCCWLDCSLLFQQVRCEPVWRPQQQAEHLHALQQIPAGYVPKTLGPSTETETRFLRFTHSWEELINTFLGQVQVIIYLFNLFFIILYLVSSATLGSGSQTLPFTDEPQTWTHLITTCPQSFVFSDGIIVKIIYSPFLNHWLKTWLKQ